MADRPGVRSGGTVICKVKEEYERRTDITPGRHHQRPRRNIHEYTLISSDEHRLLKNGEYVYYELDAATNAAAHGLNGASDAHSTASNT